MHKKSVLKPYTFKDPTTGSLSNLSANVITEPTSIEFMDRALLDIACSGAPVGDLYIEQSPDYDPNNKDVIATWRDIGLSLAAMTGSPESYSIDMLQTAIRWIRVRFSAGVGSTGSMVAKVSGKES